MKLNLEFYKGEDKYTDGDIEDRILYYIKKYPNNYENALKKDNSWPVVYHLSDIRHNVINWYPFKKDASILEVGAGMGAITSELCKKCKSVTSIELSKRRATAILERNKNVNNLEIIVGNFQDIEFDKKFDYVLLNGVLEYGSLYIQSERPYIDFITKVKTYLKKGGKILIAIENRFGLKYWCGANEDHTNVMFDGINDYPTSKDIKTFSKNELEELAEICGMDINFYYMFPDYKFPELIYTDKSLSKNIFCEYGPYYCNVMTTFIDERRVYNQIYKDNMIPFFSNSYFVELGENLEDVKIEFVKFNNYRNNKYKFFTYLKDDKFYKKALNDNCNKHLDTIYNNYNLLKNNNIDILELTQTKNEVSSPIYLGKSLTSILDECIHNNQFDKVIFLYTDLFQYLKKHSGKKKNGVKDTIFNKYKIKLKNDHFEYYEYGIIDAIPSNIFVKSDKFIFFDQEWIEYNTPIEFVVYRAITQYFNCVRKNDKLISELYKKFKINKEDILLFEKLEKAFIEKIVENGNQYFNQFYINYNYISNVNQRMLDIDIYINENKKLISENSRMKELNNNINNQLQNIYNQLQNIYNSKGYKILNKFYILKNKIIKKGN